MPIPKYRGPKLAAVALLAALAAHSARAADPAAGEVQSTISAQIDAFRHDDGARAYSYAGPNIHMLFPSPDAFMAMVRGGYAPVYRPQAFEFGPLSEVGGRLIQSVDITAADGSAWVAEYTLAREADGSLKIEGCRLVKRPGIGA